MHARADAEHTERAGTRRALALLAAGGLLGMAAAAASLLATDPQPRALPDDAVARVGDVLIERGTYERALAALASDRRDPLSPEDAHLVLERLVDEELLVQRGIGLDLVRDDRFTRGALVNAVIALVTGQAEEETPSRDALRAFYREHRDFFASPGRLHLEQVFVRARGIESDPDAETRARRAAQRLRRGEPLEAVAESLGDRATVPIPDAPLPPRKLREYLGPTPVRVALQLGTGDVSEPVRSSLGYHVLRVVARSPAYVPPFEEVEAQVQAEYRRRAGDRALRAYLERLRDEVDVLLAPDAEVG